MSGGMKHSHGVPGMATALSGHQPSDVLQIVAIGVSGGRGRGRGRDGAVPSGRGGVGVGWGGVCAQVASAGTRSSAAATSAAATIRIMA